METIDKLNEMKCAECGYSDAEYFRKDEEIPLCKECLADMLIQENHDVYEIQDLDDEDENDIEIINKLWEEQEHQHKK